MMGDQNMFRKGPPMEGSARIPFITKFAKGNGQAGQFNASRHNGNIIERLRNIVIKEYKSRPFDDMLDSDGNMKSGRVLSAYRSPVE